MAKTSWFQFHSGTSLLTRDQIWST